MHKKPTITIHRADSRGGGEHGWLSTRHSFSFANWYDPTRMGFGALRVLNDDTITPKNGFGMHGHDNMEIITIVTEGVLGHEDSMGNTGTVSSGEVQVMSAGTGIRHSEYNQGESNLKLLQIWISSDTRNVPPRYEQQAFPQVDHGETLLVAPMGHPKTLTIHQNAFISRLSLDTVHPLEYTVKKEGNGVYFFVIAGDAVIAHHEMSTHDGLGIEHMSQIPLITQSNAQVLAIEVPIT